MAKQISTTISRLVCPDLPQAAQIAPGLAFNQQICQRI